MLYKLTLWHESINYLTFVSNIFITKHLNYEEKIITIYNVGYGDIYSVFSATECRR